ncbi:MFS transporter [Agromyces sp. PvR057]|uniref:MFS transporter n=1 Tax=Agromyces sp. PvR057 TaxID=3156403 RepID=UPI00339990BC
MYISLSDRRRREDPETSPAGGTTETGATGTPPPPVRRAGRVSSTVVALGFVSLFTDVSSEASAAVLPLYLTGALGLSVVAYGVIDGLYQGVSSMVRIAAGWASDRADRPKRVALVGYGLSALARIGLLFATGFAAITAVVVGDRIGKGIRTAPRDALIAASAEPAELGRSFGVHRMLDTVGAATGPLIAFAVLLIVPEGYRTVFVVSLAFALLGVVVLGALVPDRRPRAERATDDAPPAPFRWRLLRAPRLVRLLVAAGLLGLVTIGDGFLYLALHDRLGFAPMWFPLLFVGTNVVYLALAVPIGRLGDRIGGRRVLIGGHVVLLCAYVLASLPLVGAGAVAASIGCLVLLGVFYAATDGILAALASAFVPVEARTSGIAAAQTVVAVTRFVAATTFGLLWFALGVGPALLIAAGALAVLIPVAAILLRPRPAEGGASAWT